MDQGPSVRSGLHRTVGVYSHRDQSFDADIADGLKPIRTVGVMMLGAKRAVFIPTALAYSEFAFCSWHSNPTFDPGLHVAARILSLLPHITERMYRKNVTFDLVGR